MLDNRRSRPLLHRRRSSDPKAPDEADSQGHKAPAMAEQQLPKLK
jgi:hypothetical protein